MSALPPKSVHWQPSLACPLWADTVEKVVSDPPKRNNRIRTARYLNRNCVRGRDFESMLRIQGRKIVFQQYRPIADIPPHSMTSLARCHPPSKSLAIINDAIKQLPLLALYVRSKS